MSKEQKIIYEPHPVTAERKAELRADGYKIIDAVFAPQGHARENGPTVAEYVAAGYFAVNYPPKGYVSVSTDDEIAEAIAAQAAESKPIDKLKVDELKALLTDKGIEIPEGAKKDDLVALLTPAE